MHELSTGKHLGLQRGRSHPYPEVTRIIGPISSALFLNTGLHRSSSSTRSPCLPGTKLLLLMQSPQRRVGRPAARSSKARRDGNGGSRAQGPCPGGRDQTPRRSELHAPCLATTSSHRRTGERRAPPPPPAARSLPPRRSCVRRRVAASALSQAWDSERPPKAMRLGDIDWAAPSCFGAADARRISSDDASMSDRAGPSGGGDGAFSPGPRAGGAARAPAQRAVAGGISAVISEAAASDRVRRRALAGVATGARRRRARHAPPQACSCACTPVCSMPSSPYAKPTRPGDAHGPTGHWSGGSDVGPRS